MNRALWDSLGSFWLTEEYTPNLPLASQIQADVAIIGGGITGLSSAYHLKRRYPEKHIVLIEGQAVGFGASGRNSGLSRKNIMAGMSVSSGKEPRRLCLIPSMRREAINC
jgi:glycine/D-amino acid oxidase-like deaminating enzyme